MRDVRRYTAYCRVSRFSHWSNRRGRAPASCFCASKERHLWTCTEHIGPGSHWSPMEHCCFIKHPLWILMTYLHLSTSATEKWFQCIAEICWTYFNSRFPFPGKALKCTSTRLYTVSELSKRRWWPWWRSQTRCDGQAIGPNQSPCRSSSHRILGQNMWRTSCMCNSWCKLWRLRWDSKLKAMKAIHLPLGFSYARLVEKMCLNSCQASRLHFIGNHCLYMQLGCQMLQNHLDLNRFFCCSTSFEPLESLESTDWCKL